MVTSAILGNNYLINNFIVSSLTSFPSQNPHKTTELHERYTLPRSDGVTNDDPCRAAASGQVDFGARPPKFPPLGMHETSQVPLQGSRRSTAGEVKRSFESTKSSMSGSVNTTDRSSRCVWSLVFVRFAFIWTFLGARGSLSYQTDFLSLKIASAGWPWVVHATDGDLYLNGTIDYRFFSLLVHFLFFCFYFLDLLTG